MTGQEQALASKAQAQTRYTVPVVTEVEPAADFWRAEGSASSTLSSAAARAV